MSSMFTKQLIKNPLFISIILFSLAYFIIFPFQNFAVNDDWLFVRQVEAFTQHKFKINALIDPTFILQGFIGMIWGVIAGVSFISMRVLTFIFSVIFLIIISKILDKFNVSKRIKLATLLLVAFNPLIFTSSMSFMTEIYFLVFMSLSIYFYLKGNLVHTNWFLLGSLFSGLAFCIRQVSAVTILAFIFSYLIFYKKVNKKHLILNLIIFALFVIGASIFPKYGDKHILSALTDLSNFSDRIFSTVLSKFYLVFFISPFIYFVDFKRTKLFYIVSIMASLALTLFIFNLDIFPVGNIFYIEELYGKSNFRSNLHLFNNVFFKLILSFYICYSLTNFVYIAIKNIYVKNFISVFLLLNTLGMFFIILFISDFYDRYLLPTFISLVLFLIYTLKDTLKFKISGILALLFIMIIAFALQFEYISQIKLKWDLATKLSNETGYDTQINIDGTYLRYVYAVKKNDYEGVTKSIPVENYKCFVQKYGADTNSPTLTLFNSSNSFLERFIENPKIYGSYKNDKLPRIQKNLDDLVYKVNYPSLLYNLVGKEAFVGAWCEI